jgi:hypothetical protein
LLPPNFFVAKIGRNWSIIITTTIIRNHTTRKVVEKGLPAIKWKMIVHKYANCGHGRIGAIHPIIQTITSRSPMIIQAVIIELLLQEVNCSLFLEFLLQIFW